MTDEEFAAWLADPSAIRVVIVEAIANVAGTETTFYWGRRNYVTSATDTPANTPYLPIIEQGVRFTEQISLTADARLSMGDIEINNFGGGRDAYLDYIWDNRQVQAWIGDARWAREDFRMIFNGIADSMNSKGRDRLSLKLRDKLQRLNTPVTEAKLGGSTENKDELIPLTFGEGHNVTPLLSDPALLQYQVHNGTIESIIEVRDNGIPVDFTANLTTGTFTLDQEPEGMITASVQGDKDPTYLNTVANLVKHIVKNYGKESERFVDADLDLTSLTAFNTACPQPVGAYLNGRTNVLDLCTQLAASVGARPAMTRLGLLKLVRIELPPSGTPFEIGERDMVQFSLRVAERIKVRAAVKLGFNRNYTVQDNLLTTIPADHKDLFALEWLTETVTDATVQADYKLFLDPEQQDTLLLRRSDANDEAQRQLDIFKTQRTIYQFEGYARMLQLELGQAVTITDSRFGLSGGATGMVVSLEPNWDDGHVTVGVLI